MALRIVLLSAAAALLLAGCTTDAGAPPGTVDQKSPSYTMGYDDGCAASNQDARKAHQGPVKNDQLYGSDASYYAGWNDGFKKCENKMTPSALPIPGNSVIM
ncbi:MAG TPA: hypothetical protein VLW75_05010 [Rhizomicrobium sp.]|nr:hypothetical protein [Rhizomicrobium sp.]